MDVISSDEVRENLSANVRRLMDEHGLSQSELARRTDQSLTAIHCIFKGQSNPTLSVALRLAIALDVSVEDLVAKPVGKPRKKTAAA